MFKNAIADSAMWDNVVTDHDSNEHIKLVARATVALAGTWPFLAAAQSSEEFDHRLALMQEQIETSTPPEILTEVVASLRDNFRIMHTARLQERAMARTAARAITPPVGVSDLPQAYVHVHKHGAGDEEYFQVDHVASPTWMNTIAHLGDHDEAMTTARQYALPNGLPLYENGKYVEGSKHRSLFRPDEEFFDAKTGRWVPVSSLPSVTAHQSWSPGGSAVVVPSVEAHARMRSNWGDLAGEAGPRYSAYAPDPDKEWRYHYPDMFPAAPGQGGQPTTPNAGQGIAQPVQQTSVGPDGFPMDFAQGEDRSGEAYARQLTPQPWTVTPGTEWRDATLPNAATGLPQGQRTGSQGRPDFSQRTAGMWPLVDHPNPLSTGEKTQSCPNCGSTHVVTTGVHGYPGTGAGGAGRAGDPGGGTRVECKNCGHGEYFSHTSSRTAVDHGDWEGHERSTSDDFHGSDKPYWKCKDCGSGNYSHGSTCNNCGERNAKQASHTAAQRGLTALLTSMNNGDRRSVSTNNGHSYSVGYNSEQAMGDDNKPARGYTVGGYDVTHDQSGRSLGYYRHTPHGPTLEGAKRYAAEQAADTIARHARDQQGHHASKTATEGAVPTPGPNPNYFGQGTEGLAGPPSFPEDPAAGIEPKTDNRMDDLYGNVPPQQSSGSSEGQIDGAGYSRMGAARQGAKTKYQPGYPHMTIHSAETFRNGDEPEFQLHEVKMHESPDSDFTVGHWPSSTVEEKAKDFGSQYMRWNGHRTDPPVHKLGSRLGFSGGRTAVSTLPPPEHIETCAHCKGRGEVGREDEESTCPSCGGAGWIDKTASRSEPGLGCPNCKDAFYTEADRTKHIRDKHPGEYSGPTEDMAFAKERMKQGTRRVAVTPEEHARYWANEPESPTCTNPWCKDEPYHTEAEHIDPPDRDPYSDESRAAMQQLEHAMSPHHDAMDLLDTNHHGPSRYSRRVASTDGRIVGVCDHCGEPVRYHTERGGHLQHLHNASSRCADGKSATAMRVQMDGFEARMKLSAFVDTAVDHDRDHYTDINTPDRGVECPNCSGKGYVPQPFGSSTCGLCNGAQRVPKQVKKDFQKRTGAVLENPTADNPTGRGDDPYRARTAWEGFEKQRPRQRMEDMNANTPTSAPDPIRHGPNANSPLPGTRLDDDGPRERGDQDEDDDD